MAMIVALGIVAAIWAATYIGYLRSRVSGYVFSERNMSEAMNYVDAAVYMKDRQGRFIYANSALLRLRGIDIAALGKRNGKNVWAHLSSESLNESDQRVFQVGERTREEIIVGSGENQTVYLESKYPLFNKKGHIVGLIGISTDVTELFALRQELEQATRTDELTGLYNRRAFFEFADIGLANARRHGRPLSLMIIDIDHFKRINDLFGHPVGDRVLEDVAARMSSAIRDVDRLARIGGEEFAVLLPETDIEQALDIGSRIRLALQPIPLQGGASVKPTVSIGLATLHPEDQSIHNLYQRADEALYRAKASGRDKISVE